MVKLLTASVGWSRLPERSPHLPQSAGVPVGPRVSCWLRAVAVVVRTGKHGPLVTSWTGRGEVPRHADPSAEPAAPPPAFSDLWCCSLMGRGARAAGGGERAVSVAAWQLGARTGAGERSFDFLIDKIMVLEQHIVGSV